ncbi:hypothetical protein OESDEN_02440 [Oesophagostomum dentatum]|uniref:Uncharacterized protein n=1 Tax=Oesophagostomum dentatum TaxID=61180 RepID=A0A0B1TNB8_OESDE|nr:hypothetical protein OESDEN_02440 [Oesophagostomum dentatum]
MLYVFLVLAVISHALAHHEPQAANCVSCDSQPPEYYPQQQEEPYTPEYPNPPIPERPPVYPVYVPPYPYRARSSEGMIFFKVAAKFLKTHGRPFLEKRCGRCKYLKTSCIGAPNGFECYEANIKNYIDHHGCKSAILSCDNSTVPVALVTSNGDTLMEGVHAEKIVKCGRSERWCSRDSENHKVNFRTVRCIVGQAQPQTPPTGFPLPGHPMPGLPGKPHFHPHKGGFGRPHRNPHTTTPPTDSTAAAVTVNQ